MLGWLRRRRVLHDTQGVALRRRDCHCHVLPGVDDGSRDQAESLAMLRLLHHAGARHIIATPHIFPGHFDNELDDLRRRFDVLQAASSKAGVDVTLELGAEHYLGEDLLLRIRQGEIAAFGPERYVLFETPSTPEVPSGLLKVVRTLRDAGHTPLLAHVERYPYLRDEPGEELCEDLRQAGARFQVNRTVGRANRLGHGVRGRFLAWLHDRDWIDEVGSDLHRATQDGRPYLTSAR